MTIKPKPKTAPLKGLLLVTAMSGTVAWFIKPPPDASTEQVVAFVVLAVIFGIFSLKLMARLQKWINLRLNLWKIKKVTTDHGSSRQATKEERSARGMDKSETGELLGLDANRNPVFRPADSFLGLHELSPGWGKSSCQVIPFILNRAMRGYSGVVSNPKTDLSVMLIRHLRLMGIECWVCNPAHCNFERVSDDPLGLYQPILDALYSDDRRKDVVKLANDYAFIHYPVMGDDKNPYFSNGSRRAIMVAILILAVLDPANCTPTGVYKLMSDPVRFVRRLNHCAKYLEAIQPDDPVIEVLKTEAANLLAKYKENKENFFSFLEGASQRLISFNPAGHLNDYGKDATLNISALRERQIILFLDAPLSHMREFSDFLSLNMSNILAVCKAKPDGHPVWLCCEEALLLTVPALVATLESLREFRVSVDMFIQGFPGLIERYGKQGAEAIESYADVRTYGGINSYQRAKFLSEVIGKETRRAQDYAYGFEATQINMSSKEFSRPHMTPDEIMAMPRRQIWAFVRGMRPMKLTLVNYSQVTPWTSWVDNSPITHSRLHDKPILHIDYPERAK